MRLWVEATSCCVALSGVALLNGDLFGVILFGSGAAFQCLCFLISIKLFPK